MSNENPKIPCGGFRIGDGLAMDGDTLKSLGGAFVKVTIDNDGKGKIAEDSPLKYDDIKRIVFDSGSEEVNLKFPIFCVDNHGFILPFMHWSGSENGAQFGFFYMTNSPTHKMGYVTTMIFEDNTVQSIVEFFTLTPAT